MLSLCRDMFSCQPCAWQCSCQLQLATLHLCWDYTLLLAYAVKYISKAGTLCWSRLRPWRNKYALAESYIILAMLSRNAQGIWQLIFCIHVTPSTIGFLLKVAINFSVCIISCLHTDKKYALSGVACATCKGVCTTLV